MIPSPVLNVTIQAVRKAGALAVRHFDNRHQLQVREKSPGNYVTNADEEVERELMYHLKKFSRDYSFLMEEKGGRLASEGWQWIIDPIDGTTNFLRGIPHFALSVALAFDGEVVAGVVYQPVLDELFLAERGRGAFLNNLRLRVNEPAGMNEALLATGFPARHKEHMAPYLEAFRAMLGECSDMRRDGSAALDLAYTAAGRYDGYWEVRLHPWDVAAGALLVREAGGYVSDLKGEQEYLASGNIVAAPPRIHERMVTLIQESGLAQAMGRHVVIPGPVKEERSKERSGNRSGSEGGKKGATPSSRPSRRPPSP